MGLSFDWIASSPYLRAEQTAEIVAEEFKAGAKLELVKELGADESPRAIIDKLRKRRPQPGSVILVGHEPYLSSLISLLLSGKPGLQIDLKKGGLCKLTVPSWKTPSPATLEWLLAPKEMLLMV